jgi:hypothetical protein
MASAIHRHTRSFTPDGDTNTKEGHPCTCCDYCSPNLTLDPLWLRELVADMTLPLLRNRGGEEAHHVAINKLGWYYGGESRL